MGSPRRHAVKRLFDLATSTLALVVASPILAGSAAAIVLEDRGPVLYRQRRVGKDGVEFELFKLRTMVVGAETIGAGLAVNEGDPRITKVGAVLRRLSLDELPQFWNVLRGEMSIIGPRPDARVPGRALHASPAPPPRGETGDHRLGAGARAREAPLGRADRAGRLVRRAPLVLARPEDPGQDAGALFGGTYKGATGGWKEKRLTARLEATDRESLERMLGHVHDSWFDVGRSNTKATSCPSRSPCGPSSSGGGSGRSA